MDLGVGTIKFKMSVGMEQLCRIVFSRTKKGRGEGDGGRREAGDATAAAADSWRKQRDPSKGRLRVCRAGCGAFALLTKGGIARLMHSPFWKIGSDPFKKNRQPY